MPQWLGSGWVIGKNIEWLDEFSEISWFFIKNISKYHQKMIIYFQNSGKCVFFHQKISDLAMKSIGFGRYFWEGELKKIVGIGIICGINS